jgi:hypothetical protein
VVRNRLLRLPSRGLSTSLVWAGVIFWTAVFAASGMLDVGGHVILISLIEIVQSTDTGFPPA